MAISKDDILEAISSMSVLELSELITEMEDKFGVSAAAAAVAVAPKAIKEGLAKADAEEAQKKLVEAGATAELK